MADIILYLVFKILPAIAALIYAGYLVYIRSDSIRLKEKMDRINNKYKKGTAPYEMYPKLYSNQFVIAWSLITAYLIFEIPLDVYRLTQVPSLFILILRLMNVFISMIGFYLWYDLFKKKAGSS